MIRKSAIVLASCVTLCAMPSAAQTPGDDAQTRALKVLRDTILAQERRGTSAITNPPAPRVPTFEELERMYLEGKLTARQFQQYVTDYRLVRPQPVVATNQPVQAQATGPELPTGNQATNVSRLASPDSEETAAQARLAELEAKMDELINQRTNRARLQTNLAAIPSGPKSKRQRLDDLLRLVIEGKMSQADYDAQRAKIIAEPEKGRQ